MILLGKQIKPNIKASPSSVHCLSPKVKQKLSPRRESTRIVSVGESSAGSAAPSRAPEPRGPAPPGRLAAVSGAGAAGTRPESAERAGGKDAHARGGPTVLLDSDLLQGRPGADLWALEQCSVTVPPRWPSSSAARPARLSPRSRSGSRRRAVGVGRASRAFTASRQRSSPTCCPEADVR